MEASMKKLFAGCCTAIITPFKNDKIDFEALEKIIDLQLEAKVDALLFLGTTGESPTITTKERVEIIRFARKKIGLQAKLIVGTGSNCTKKAVSLSRQAEKLGADGLLVVTPYYNKCTQKGLLEHYTKIAKSVHIPIILYNVPSRTGVNILPETALELAKTENILGIKEANSDNDHILKMTDILKEKMAIYSGNDDFNYDFLSRGACGVISVTSNLFPKLVKRVCVYVKEGEHEKAKILQTQLQDLNKNLFVETNPIPVKFGAKRLGICENELRLPLTPLSKECEAKLIKSIEKVRAIL